MASITAWQVSDFKALSGAELRLEPLTILAGANSSGKSSVIQSMLMVAQTVTRGGPVVLNGPLVRLGLPEDVVRDGQKSMQLSLHIQNTSGRLVGSDLDSEGKSFQIDISLSPNKSKGTLEPNSVSITTDGAVRFAATSTRLNSTDAKILDRTIGNDLTHLRVTQIASGKAPSRMYVTFSGFTPIALSLHQDAQTIRRLLRTVLADAFDQERVPYEAALELNRLVRKDRFLQSQGVDPSQLDSSQSTRPGPPRWTTRDLSALNRLQRDALIEAASSQRARNEWVQISPGRSGFSSIPRSRLHVNREGVLEDIVAADLDPDLLHLSALTSSLQEFASRLRYLGPLRDEPRVVHGAWDERVDALPVGIRGELTAEVLTREKDRMITYRDWENTVKRGSLPNAVSAWCSYLGIGDQIKVLDLGKLGRGVNLEVQGADRDLTTIGVGASQLLPILVAGLSAPANSTILVEQPELHLHPSVQSRLADFFLFARNSVNYVVETHSEYLLTRVRRRVAENRYQPKKLQVLFAEQRSGATVTRLLNMSELGDFDDWPVGFFDTQDNDARYIVRAISSRLNGGDQ